jgi:hypothetical protein
VDQEKRSASRLVFSFPFMTASKLASFHKMKKILLTAKFFPDHQVDPEGLTPLILPNPCSGSGKAIRFASRFFISLQDCKQACVPCETKKGFATQNPFPIIRWIRRDSNPRPNKA